MQLEGLGKRYPAQLSGGQRQRMALARALAVEPEVLLLDEPFGALDARVRQELRDWLRRLHDEVHVTTVFVTHDQEEAMQIADSIVLVNKGRVEQIGSARDLYERPANEFVLTFVGEATRFGDALVRPHDVVLSTLAEPGAEEVLVERVAYLGFEVRVELIAADGRHFDAQLTHEEAERLELARRPDRLRETGPKPRRRARPRGRVAPASAGPWQGSDPYPWPARTGPQPRIALPMRCDPSEERQRT